VCVFVFTHRRCSYSENTTDGGNSQTASTHQSITFIHNVRFEVFTAVTMKIAVFWDVAPWRFCVKRRFGGTYRLHLQGRKIRARGSSVSRWMQSAATCSRWFLAVDSSGCQLEVRGEELRKAVGESEMEESHKRSSEAVTVLSRVWVTMDRVSISNWIYWTHVTIALPLIHTHTHTHIAVKYSMH
jgi:hypothetical protein